MGGAVRVLLGEVKKMLATPRRGARGSGHDPFELLRIGATAAPPERTSTAAHWRSHVSASTDADSTLRNLLTPIAAPRAIRFLSLA